MMGVAETIESEYAQLLFNQDDRGTDPIGGVEMVE